MTDDVEVGRATEPRVRVAFEVMDAEDRTQRLLRPARHWSRPTERPRRSLNSRLDAPAGQQITLFEELLTLDEHTALAGFGTDDNRRSD